ncbi:unnamed protein product [Diamesa hyperborea]
MKINERNLFTFANSKPRDKEGFLLKRGENKGFQKRWFVLKGNLLFYFDKKDDKQPLGLILMEGCSIELCEDDTQHYCFQIVFHGQINKDGKIYYLAAEDQDEMEGWMKSLTCASYDYMKLMVQELQRQLDEINTNNKGHTSENSDSSAPKAPPRRQNPFNKTSTSSTGNAESNTADVLCRQQASNNDSNRNSELTFAKLHEQIGKPIQENLKNERQILLQ